jgi:predicted MFS family arabinose efflux permease
VPLAWMGGVLADQYGLPVLFIVMALGIWLSGLVVLILWRPERILKSASIS